MAPQPYERPPITEAVIELRFAEALDKRALENASKAFADRYPKVEEISNFGLRVQNEAGAALQVSPLSEFAGFKRTSSDGLEIVIVGPQQFLVSRLPPYPGWDAFLELFSREWSLWKAKAGYRRLTRLGVRYINRIDIPVKDGVVEDADYFNIRISAPTELGHFLGVASQSKFNAPDLNCHIVLNTATVDSPLPNCISFVLDIDIGTSGEEAAPRKDEDLLVLLEKVRERKNAVFEACITDHARKLFSK